MHHQRSLMPATLLVPKNTPKWLTDRTAGSRPCFRLPSKWVYTYTVRFTNVIFSDTFCDPFIVTYLKAILILLKLWNFYIYWYCIFVHTQMIYLNCFCVCGGLDFIARSTFLDCIAYSTVLNRIAHRTTFKHEFCDSLI